MNKSVIVIAFTSVLWVSCGTDPAPWNASDVCPDAPGALHDERDGQDYKTVKIGTQTWMAQNLNYTMGNSFCYDGADSNCVKYGRLYDFPTADSACPAGWHLPSDSEWTVLGNSMGGRDEAGGRLKVSSGWLQGNATDDCGFSALPGGEGGLNSGYNYKGNRGLWWSSSPYNESWIVVRYVFIGDDVLDDQSGHPSWDYVSIRCIKD